VRRYVDANIEDVNKSRLRNSTMALLGHLGFGSIGESGWCYDWKREPGQPIRQLFDKMTLGRLIPQERKNEEIVNGMALIERYASQLLNVPDIEEGTAPGSIRPLLHIALPYATHYMGNMISLFITTLDPEKQRDRIAIMSLFQRFPPVTSNHQRHIFTAILKSITQEACFILSIAWEKHGSPAEAEASYNSLFGRCISDEGRKYFMKEVDEFRNESARKLILGDLMLMNPSRND